MKLRFEVNQAEAFRRGIDCPKSRCVLEVNPDEINKDVRALIADHMLGIDVLGVVAEEPNLNSLIIALRKKGVSTN